MFTRTSVAATVGGFVAAILLSGCGSATDATTQPDERPDDPSASATAEKVEGDDSSDGLSRSEVDAFAAAAQRQIDSQFGSFNGMYSEIRIEPIYPNGIEYVYVYSKLLDADRVEEQLDTSVAVLQASFDTQVAPEMKRAGFTSPTATWTYLNSDESVIWTRTFSES
ncbi:hypothetical protein [Mumia sp. Pv 4-285]|uniref:hypothetical protein n=1 Tax=Mumia qirimensis TaxID=3234852 RepID=UPI00351D3FFC